MTGYTLVIRESEWTDADVRDLLELTQVESESCPGCGWHESLVEDESNVFGPMNHTCPLCAAKAQQDRINADEEATHVEQHKKAPAGAPRPGDGRWTHMRLLTPEQIEQRGGPGGDTH